jgi:hypothetical protein
VTGPSQEYVVDIYIPFSVTVAAAKGDTEMARDMALEKLSEDGILKQLDYFVEPTDWYIGDADIRTEVGEGGAILE